MTASNSSCKSISVRLRRKAEATISRYAMLPCQHLLVALSGGADSVTLLHLLRTLQPEYGYKLDAMHINHMIRGEEASRDEKFCRSLCANWEIPFYSVAVDIPALAAAEHKGLEEIARCCRYQALNERANIIGADRIATAHTASDQMETVLWQLIRGTAAGNGIPPVRGKLIRPLLYVTKAEILAYMAENKLSYIQDSTNEDIRYTRNYIRHTIVPAMKKLNPQVEQAFLNFSDIRRSECQWLEEEALRHINSCRSSDAEALCDLPVSPVRANASAVKVVETQSKIQSKNVRSFSPPHEPTANQATVPGASSVCTKLSFLQSLPDPLRTRALAFYCENAGITALSHRHFEALNAFILKGRGGSRLSLPNQKIALIENGQFQLISGFSSSADTLELSPFILKEGENPLPDGSVLYAYSHINESIEKYIKEKQNIYKLFIKADLNFDKIGSMIGVRSRQPGDRILCGGIHRNIKKLYCDLHISPSKRHLLPLLYDDRGILWIPAIQKLRDGVTAVSEPALHLIYMGEKQGL